MPETGLPACSAALGAISRSQAQHACQPGYLSPAEAVAMALLSLATWACAGGLWE